MIALHCIDLIWIKKGVDRDASKNESLLEVPRCLYRDDDTCCVYVLET